MIYSGVVCSFWMIGSVVPSLVQKVVFVVTSSS